MKKTNDEGGVRFKPHDEELCKRCRGVMACAGKWEFYAGLPRPCPFDLLALDKTIAEDDRAKLRSMLEESLLR